MSIKGDFVVEIYVMSIVWRLMLATTEPVFSRSLVLRVSLFLLGLTIGGAQVSGQERSDSGQVTITGAVLDFTTLDSVQGVEVSLPDLVLVQVTDDAGTFFFEGVPLGVHEMVLQKEGYIPVRGPLTVAKSGSFVVHMRPEGSPEPGSLSGRVVDPESGVPVGTAMIELQDTGLQRMTNADGGFGFGDVPPGWHVLRVEHIGYAARSDSVRVASGRITEVEIPLAIRPIELEPITVIAQSKWMENNGFYQRMGGDYRGRQWTAEEIQGSGVTHLGDLLEQEDGIRMVWEGVRGLSILSNQGVGKRGRGWCRMPLLIDGLRPGKIDLDMVIPRHVEGLEVYHAMKAPIQYSHIEYPCGVILVWTR